MYKNINYAILGKIIEKTSGKSYAALIADIFERGKMKSSTVPLGHGRKSNHRKLVKVRNETEDGKYEEVNILNATDWQTMGIPAAGMISTAGDLDKWIYCLHNGKLLTDSSDQIMITQRVLRPHRWGEFTYADAIQVDQLVDILEYSMSGYAPGVISTIIYYPKTKLELSYLKTYRLLVLV